MYGDVINKYEYAYIRKTDRVIIGGNNNEEFDTNGLIEARFFCQNGEFRVFPDENGEFKTAVTEFNDGADNETDREFDIDGKKFGKKITVRYIIGKDEDGQAYIKNVCLKKWEGYDNE